VPTSLERITLTRTDPVGLMLSVAANQWPELATSRELVLRLMAEGASSLRRQRLEAAYEDAYSDWAGSEDAALWDSVSGDGIGETE